MMTQEQMEAEIMKLKMANNEIKATISEMQQEIKKTVSLLEQVADLMTSGK
jgi:methyl-accepting chemotaxis protein|nr:MAG TPA: Flagella accessory protein C (FlaC) [Caudoviricetes sp.]